MLRRVRERPAPGSAAELSPRASTELRGAGTPCVSLWRGSAGSVGPLRSSPAPARLGAAAAPSLTRHARLLESVRGFIRALSRSSRGAEMRSGASPRALVFSPVRPERNAVSIATCRHSVMTGERARARASLRARSQQQRPWSVVCVCARWRVGR